MWPDPCLLRSSCTHNHLRIMKVLFLTFWIPSCFVIFSWAFFFSGGFIYGLTWMYVTVFLAVLSNVICLLACLFLCFTTSLLGSLFACFFFIWRNVTQWTRASSFTRFLDHTQLRTTVGRTPLDEWFSSSQRSLPDNTQHSQQTSILQVRFEPTISTGQRPQTYAFDRAAAGNGSVY
jgi:hypothetical protein